MCKNPLLNLRFNFPKKKKKSFSIRPARVHTHTYTMYTHSVHTYTALDPIRSHLAWARNNETKVRARNTRPIGQFHVSMAEGTIGLTRHDPFYGRPRLDTLAEYGYKFHSGAEARAIVERSAGWNSAAARLNNSMDESLTNVGWRARCRVQLRSRRLSRKKFLPFTGEPSRSGELRVRP